MDSVQLLSSQTPTFRQDDEFQEDQLFNAFSADFQQTLQQYYPFIMIHILLFCQEGYFLIRYFPYPCRIML